MNNKSKDGTAASFLQDEWRVPKYQRPYTWDLEPDVEQLWNDLDSNFLRKGVGCENRKLPPQLRQHFFGVVFHSEQDGKLSLEDGQQRATALKCLRIAIRIFGSHLRASVRSEFFTNSEKRKGGVEALKGQACTLRSLVSKIEERERELVLKKFTKVEYTKKNFGNAASIEKWKRTRLGIKSFQGVSKEIDNLIDEQLHALGSFEESKKGEKVSSLIGCDKSIEILDNLIVQQYNYILDEYDDKIKGHKIIHRLLRDKKKISRFKLPDFRDDEVFKKEPAKKFKNIGSAALSINEEIELLLKDAQIFEVAMTDVGLGVLNWKECELEEAELHEFGLSYELKGVDELCTTAIKIASDFLGGEKDAVHNSIFAKIISSEEESHNGLRLVKGFRSQRQNERKVPKATRKDNSLMVQRLAATIVYFYGNCSKFYFDNCKLAKGASVEEEFAQLIALGGAENAKSILYQGLYMFSLILVSVKREEAQQFFRNINSRGKSLSSAEQIRNMLIVAEQGSGSSLTCFTKSIQTIDIDGGDSWPLSLQSSVGDYLVVETLKILAHSPKAEFSCKSKTKAQLVAGVDQFIIEHRDEPAVIAKFLREFNALMEDLLKGYRSLQHEWSEVANAKSMQKLHLDTIFFKWQLVLAKICPNPQNGNVIFDVTTIIDKLSFIFWWIYKVNRQPKDAFPEVHYKYLGLLNRDKTGVAGTSEILKVVNLLMNSLLEKLPFSKQDFDAYFVPKLEFISLQDEVGGSGSDEETIENDQGYHRDNRGYTSFYDSQTRKDEARWLLWHHERCFVVGDKHTVESLEHIHPKSKITKEFNFCAGVINAIGNFILLTTRDNTKLGDLLIKEKTQKFEELTSSGESKFMASEQAKHLFLEEIPELVKAEEDCFGPGHIETRSQKIADALFSSFEKLVPTKEDAS